jgi:hypothetical protein
VHPLVKAKRRRGTQAARRQPATSGGRAWPLIR